MRRVDSAAARTEDLDPNAFLRLQRLAAAMKSTATGRSAGIVEQQRAAAVAVDGYVAHRLGDDGGEVRGLA